MIEKKALKFISIISHQTFHYTHQHHHHTPPNLTHYRPNLYCHIISTIPYRKPVILSISQVVITSIILYLPSVPFFYFKNQFQLSLPPANQNIIITYNVPHHTLQHTIISIIYPYHLLTPMCPKTSNIILPVWSTDNLHVWTNLIKKQPGIKQIQWFDELNGLVQSVVLYISVSKLIVFILQPPPPRLYTWCKYFLFWNIEM